MVTPDLDVVLGKNTTLLELDTTVEGSLTTKGQQQTIGALALNDRFNISRRHREEVDLVSKTLHCLDGGNVGVDEDGADTLLFHGLHCLRPFESVNGHA